MGIAKHIDISSLSIGQIVYYIANTGSVGIFQYQYTGIIKNYFTGEDVHLFLSEYLLSTVVVQVGSEYKSRSVKKMFMNQMDAKEEQNNMRLRDEEY
jgi:hypothetical protein